MAEKESSPAPQPKSQISKKMPSIFEKLKSEVNESAMEHSNDNQSNISRRQLFRKKYDKSNGDQHSTRIRSQPVPINTFGNSQRKLRKQQAESVNQKYSRGKNSLSRSIESEDMHDKSTADIYDGLFTAIKNKKRSGAGKVEISEPGSALKEFEEDKYKNFQYPMAKFGSYSNLIQEELDSRLHTLKSTACLERNIETMKVFLKEIRERRENSQIQQREDDESVLKEMEEEFDYALKELLNTNNLESLSDQEFASSLDEMIFRNENKERITSEEKFSEMESKVSKKELAETLLKLDAPKRATNQFFEDKYEHSLERISKEMIGGTNLEDDLSSNDRLAVVIDGVDSKQVFWSDHDLVHREKAFSIISEEIKNRSMPFSLDLLNIFDTESNFVAGKIGPNSIRVPLQKHVQKYLDNIPESVAHRRLASHARVILRHPDLTWQDKVHTIRQLSEIYDEYKLAEEMQEFEPLEKSTISHLHHISRY